MITPTPPDTPGIHAIYEHRPDRVADVVFLHGLGGKSHSTWRHGRTGEAGHYFWPEELAKERSEWGVWSVGYDAGMTRAGAQGLLISQRARNISNQMINLGFGSKPIVLICHSMGGLVAKSLIVQSLGLGNEPLRSLVSMIRGIVFCGTPHRGSAVAAAANSLEKYYATVGGLLAGLPGRVVGWLLARRFGTQDHVKQMKSNDVLLDELHDEFIQWQRHNGIPVDCYAESRPLRRWRALGLVVERASANAGINRPHEVDADHLELVKPPPPGHPNHNLVYLGTRRFIDDALKPVEPPPGFPGTTETYRIIRELFPHVPHFTANPPS